MSQYVTRLETTGLIALLQRTLKRAMATKKHDLGFHGNEDFFIKQI